MEHKIIEKNKPYLVDVPVFLMVFIRPDTLAQVFQAIKLARPSILFLVSDGPRSEVPTDFENITKSRRIVEDIDWNCTVYKLYNEVNQGLYSICKKSLSYAFERVDRLIFLEDDIKTTQSFFAFCAQLLERYKDDLRISMICGMNHEGYTKETNSDYFFSRLGSIWGIAFWKRTYQSFYQYTYAEDKYVLKNMKSCIIPGISFKKSLCGYPRNQMVNGHPAGLEFFLHLLVYSQNQLCIIPKKNMVCNLGYVSGSVHASDSLKKMSRGSQKLFNMKTYKVEFPLEHPMYVFPDKKYEKKLKRIMAWGFPLVRVYRKAESIIKRIYYGEAMLLLGKLKSKIFRKGNIET